MDAVNGLTAARIPSSTHTGETLIQCAMLRPLLALALVSLATPALGQGLIADRRVVADFFQGPIIAPGRVVGLGGAYIGVAEGAAGHLANPAAFAVRAAPFAHDWFDWDVTLSTLNVSQDQGIDVGHGSGQSFDDARFLQFGLNLKFGAHGFGAHGRTQDFVRRVDTVDPETGTTTSRQVTVRQTYAGLGYGLQLNDDWWLGGLLYGGTAALLLGGEDAARVNGGGLLLGALYAPPGARWRLGLTARTPVVGKEVQETPDPGDVPPGVEVPDAVAVPWQIGVGASYVLGPRGGNVRPTFGEGAADAPPPARRYVLLAADLVVTGPAPEAAVGPDALFSADNRRSGRYASVSPRVGAESEVWSDVLVVRAGSYFEPDRYAAFDGRVHLTGGVDVHLGELIWDWQAGLVLDWAPDYLNWGLGLGFWH